jgi:hypothetical protein
MTELGNEVVNKIYEATYDEILSDIERATDNCDDDVRKKWICAKYVDRKFVLPLKDARKGNELLPPHLMPTSPNKWSVKKSRRRTVTKRYVYVIFIKFNCYILIKLNIFNIRNLNNNIDTKITTKENALMSEDEKEVNEGILMLGDKLQDSTIPVQCTLFSNSDQESTSGEEDVLGKLLY